jgi:hypothetical protein
MSQHSRRAMTRSALAVAQEALAVAERSIPAYSSKYSPKRFTQHQHFAILAVRQFFDLDYRSTEALLGDWSDLREVIGLKAVPDHSTLEKAEKRLLKKGASTGSSTASVAPPATAA